MKAVALTLLAGLGVDGGPRSSGNAQRRKRFLPSTVSITATPSPLILPGTLTLSTTVNQLSGRGRSPYGYGKFLL